MSRIKSYIPHILVIVLLAAASVALGIRGEIALNDEAGIKTILPERVGEWVGYDMLFCQNENCRKDYKTMELEDTSHCPACGGKLDPMSIGENRLLPKDTVLLRKMYKSTDDRTLLVAIVLSGRERSSIHRPQVCLKGQGGNIVGSEIVPAPLEGRDPVNVMVLDVDWQHDLGGGRTFKNYGYYAYWFVGVDRETPYHLERMIWMAYDRVFKNVSHRWAYIALSGNRDPQSREYEDEIRDFVRDFYPQVML